MKALLVALCGLFLCLNANAKTGQAFYGKVPAQCASFATGQSKISRDDKYELIVLSESKQVAYVRALITGFQNKKPFRAVGALLYQSKLSKIVVIYPIRPDGKICAVIVVDEELHQLIIKHIFKDDA